MAMNSLVGGLLLAQAAEAPVSVLRGMPDWVPILAGVLAAIVGLVIVPTVLGLRHARREREMEHAERMRALELGHPLPGTVPGPPRSPAVSVGLWVPLGVFITAFVANQHNPDPTPWIAAAIVGATAVICGTILALWKPAPTPPAHHYAGTKPNVDPAAMEDLAGRR